LILSIFIALLNVRLVLIEKKKIESSLLEVLEKAQELDYYELRSLSVKMDKINAKLKKLVK